MQLKEFLSEQMDARRLIRRFCTNGRGVTLAQRRAVVIRKYTNLRHISKVVSIGYRDCMWKERQEEGTSDVRDYSQIIDCGGSAIYPNRERRRKSRFGEKK